MIDKISLVGLGKLGQCLAMTLAHRGIKTYGIDIDENLIFSLNKGISTVDEPGLQSMLEQNKDRLTFSNDSNIAIDETDTTIILVGTPGNREGWFSNEYVESAIKALSVSLSKSSKKYHRFLISSTVMPGSINEKIIPLIEKYSGREFGQGFGVCYCPELIALGTVINDFLEPSLVMLGSDKDSDGDFFEEFYNDFTLNIPKISRMSIINTELSKVSFNFFLTNKISFD